MVNNRYRKSFGLRQKNSKSCSDNWHCWRFWSPFKHFRTHFTETFHMSKSSRMTDPTHSCVMPSCSAIVLAKIQRSSKISSWIWSIISGVVSILGHPGWDTSQVEKTPHVSMLLKSGMLPDMLPFSLRNKKRLAIWHTNRPLFPMTVSIPSYDIGK